MESDFQDVAEEYQAIYRAHYSTIRTRVTRGRIKTVYHFLITGNYSRNEAKKLLASLDTEFDVLSHYKVNASFGFILRNVDTDELKLFYPSQNSMVYDTPQRLSSKSDFKKLLNDLDQEDARAYAMANRPSTKWRLAKIACIRFDVYKLSTTSH